MICFWRLSRSPRKVLVMINENDEPCRSPSWNCAIFEIFMKVIVGRNGKDKEKVKWASNIYDTSGSVLRTMCEDSKSGSEITRAPLILLLIFQFQKAWAMKNGQPKIIWLSMLCSACCCCFFLHGWAESVWMISLKRAKLSSIEVECLLNRFSCCSTPLFFASPEAL